MIQYYTGVPSQCVGKEKHKHWKGKTYYHCCRLHTYINFKNLNKSNDKLLELIITVSRLQVR